MIFSIPVWESLKLRQATSGFGPSNALWGPDSNPTSESSDFTLFAGDLTGEMNGSGMELWSSLPADGNHLSYVFSGVASKDRISGDVGLANTAAPAGERDGTPHPANGKTAGPRAPTGLSLAPCTQKYRTTTPPSIPPSLRASHVPLAATVGNRQSARQPFPK